MITRFMTNVAVRFNPLSAKSKTARLFLSLIPPNARQGLKIEQKISEEQPFVDVTFKDGTRMQMQSENYSIKDLVDELDRHSRALQRKEELVGG